MEKCNSTKKTNNQQDTKKQDCGKDCGCEKQKR